ncbi:MAG: hypothetical protein AAB561_00085 [Patescibacteria group bacterium]
MSEFPKPASPEKKSVDKETMTFRPDNFDPEKTGVFRIEEIKEGEIVDVVNDESGLGPWRVIGYELTEKGSHKMDPISGKRTMLLEQAFGPNTLKVSEDEVIKNSVSLTVEKLAMIADKIVGTEVEMQFDKLNLGGRWKVNNIVTENGNTFVELQRGNTTMHISVADFEKSVTSF